VGDSEGLIQSVCRFIDAFKPTESRPLNYQNGAHMAIGHV
jgi:hypothetical protein